MKRTVFLFAVTIAATVAAMAQTSFSEPTTLYILHSSGNHLEMGTDNGGWIEASTKSSPQKMVIVPDGKGYYNIQVSGKENLPKDHVYDVTGSLCENCDKFAVQRELPQIDEGDLLIIHDAGAHGRSMGFNYNGKLRAGELLLRSDGSVTQIRRRETIDDYFATLDFSGLDSFKA